ASDVNAEASRLDKIGLPARNRLQYAYEPVIEGIRPPALESTHPRQTVPERIPSFEHDDAECDGDHAQGEHGREAVPKGERVFDGLTSDRTGSWHDEAVADEPGCEAKQQA